MPKDGFLGLVDIFHVPFILDPGEVDGGIEDCKAKEEIRAVNGQQMILHIARTYTSVSSIRT